MSERRSPPARDYARYASDPRYAAARSDRRSRSPPARRSRSPPRRHERSPPRRERSPPRRDYTDNPWRNKDGTYKKNERTSNCVGIFGLDWDTTDRELERKFQRYGRIAKTVLVWNHKERRNKGFGFVTFEDVHSAEDAVKDMNGRTIEGRPVRVDFSFTKHGNKEHMYDDKGERKEQYAVKRDESPVRRSRSPYRRVSRSPPRRRSRSPYAR